MEDEVKKFGDFLRKKREAKAISQEKLSLIVFGNTNRAAYISGIETGKREGITLKLMARLLQPLNVEINYKEL